MATFKVWQRVRIVGVGTANASYMLGKTATIWKISGRGWAEDARQRGVPNDAIAHLLDVDGEGRRWPNGTLIGMQAHQIAPLTDPGEDAWADAQVKKWTKPRPEILTEKVTQ